MQERIDRALDALLDGGPRNELNARIEAEKVRRAALTDELARLDQHAAITELHPAKLQQLLWECLAEIEKLFGKGSPQVRQMLRALSADKIEMEPVDGFARLARNGNGGHPRDNFQMLIDGHRENLSAIFALDAPNDRAADLNARRAR